MISCLDTILAPGGLTARFEPILEMRPEVTRLHSMEGLVRGPRGTNVESAVILFEYVRRRLKEPVVDRACVAAVCRAGRRLPEDVAFSVNVHAVTLARDRGFVDHLHDTAARHSIDPHRITIEIVEHGPAWAGQDLGKALAAARRLGFAVALDDVGCGQSNYRMMIDCCPDYLKIDRYFVAGCHLDQRRCAVLDSVCRLGQKLGARVVAEGVEAYPDLKRAMDVGIDLFQGYLLSPAPAHGEPGRARSLSAPGEGFRTRRGELHPIPGDHVPRFFDPLELLTRVKGLLQGS